MHSTTAVIFVKSFRILDLACTSVSDNMESEYGEKTPPMPSIRIFGAIAILLPISSIPTSVSPEEALRKNLFTLVTPIEIKELTLIGTEYRNESAIIFLSAFNPKNDLINGNRTIIFAVSAKNELAINAKAPDFIQIANQISVA